MKQYDTYKDSGIEWIGDIPSHWETVPIKYSLAVPLTDGPHETPEIVSEGVTFISAEAIKEDKIDFEKKRGNISIDDHERFSKKYKPQRGDVFMVKSGATTGNLARVETDLEFNIWSPLAAFRPSSQKVSSDFLFFFMKSKRFFTAVELGWNYGTQQNIGMNVLENIRMVRPPVSEQTAIANYLDQKTAEIDALIADKKRLLELYEKEKTAIINHAVTKGINPKAKMKDSGIDWLGEIPEHWEVTRLKYVAKINPPKKQAFKNLIEDVVFLPMERVNEDGSFDDELRKPVSELWNGYTYFERGDIIIAKITPCFENRKGTFLSDLKTDFGFGSTEFHVIRAQLVHPAFLYYVTRSEIFMKIGEAFMTGAAGQKRVPTDFVSEFLFAFPKEKEQQIIVHYIKTECARVDSKITKTKKLIELLTEYRTALISEVVTGKIKVID